LNWSNKLMRAIRMALSIVLLALVALPGHAAVSKDQISAAIASILGSGQKLPLPIERARAALQAHYVKNRGPIFWIGTGRSALMIQKLDAAAQDGLDPSSYPIDALRDLALDAENGTAMDAAEAELYYSSFLISYAAELRTGRVSPEKVDPNLFRARKTIDSLRVLTDFQKQPNLAKFLATYEPKNNHYQTLKRMLKIYSKAVEQGVSWPRIADGAAIKPGQSDPRLPAIRTILTTTGDFEGSAGNSPVYDSQTVAAMTRFQQRHGLEAKGLIGKQSILSLNIQPADRLRQIVLNMERWRWMPDNLGTDHFLVNIAGFELRHVVDNKTVERMDVVVGAIATQTPEFSAPMKYVELNPTWTVPYSIATTEMLPKLKADPYAYAQEFELFVNGKLAQWGSVNWAGYGPGNFPFLFRQKPGPKNALGKVKFMLPNAHNIYLHDTPAKDKFANTTRAFSHGCIRLSRPGDLAYELLADEVGMSPGEVDAIWAAGQTTKVDLPQPIPVHLVYATAFSTNNGIEFRPDVYGRDKKLYQALFGRGGV
jgi:L,D-transpeptidase YcbB